MAYIITKIQDFLKLETTSGIILMVSAVLALIASNTFLNVYYGALLSTPVAIQIGGFEIAKPLLLWINDGLMALFFFLVGLEIKREVLQGELSSLGKAGLPIFAAIGGMAAPALIYVYFNWGDAEALRGWAAPAATDIAFALGFLALVGARAPTSLKIFLLAVAIIDDLGAIAIIALFYTEDLSLAALGASVVGIAGLTILNRIGVKKITPYALIGLFIWVCVLKSGVHATLAGVVTALFIPMVGDKADSQSPLHSLEHSLHPWIAFMVMPVFAFANAGLSLNGLSFADLLKPIPLGMVLGLFVGKPVGVVLMSLLAIKSGLVKMPEGMRMGHLVGVAWLTGVGFTMSLFIGGLAFSDASHLNDIRLGVLVGSLMSGAAGCTVLFLMGQSGQPASIAQRPSDRPDQNSIRSEGGLSIGEGASRQPVPSLHAAPSHS